jgi:hypothetical protein
VERFRDYALLKRAFERWAGFKWIDSMEQNRALRREALRLGIPFRPVLPSLPLPRRERFPVPTLARIIKTTQRRVYLIDRLGRKHVRDRKTGRFVHRR